MKFRNSQVVKNLASAIAATVWNEGKIPNHPLTEERLKRSEKKREWREQQIKKGEYYK
jgi:hypothetical protein